MLAHLLLVPVLLYRLQQVHRLCVRLQLVTAAQGFLGVAQVLHLEHELALQIERLGGGIHLCQLVYDQSGLVLFGGETALDHTYHEVALAVADQSEQLGVLLFGALHLLGQRVYAIDARLVQLGGVGVLICVEGVVGVLLCLVVEFLAVRKVHRVCHLQAHVLDGQLQENAVVVGLVKVLVAFKQPLRNSEPGMLLLAHGCYGKSNAFAVVVGLVDLP